MKSKTLQPFRTTNLVVVRATNVAGGSTCSDCFACGDALLLDPGCNSQVHAEVRAISSVCFLENCSPIFMPTKFYTYMYLLMKILHGSLNTCIQSLEKFLNNSTYLPNMIYVTA